MILLLMLLATDCVCSFNETNFCAAKGRAPEHYFVAQSIENLPNSAHFTSVSM